MRENIYTEMQVQSIPDSWMNLNDKKSPLYESMEAFMVFLLSYPALAGILYYFTRNNSYVNMGYILLPCVLYMVVVRNYVYNNLLHIIAYVPLFAMAFYLINPLELKISFIVYLAAMTIVSMVKRTKTIASYYNFNFIFIGDVILLAIYIAALYKRFMLIENMVIFHAIMFSLIFLIYLHITRTKKLMEWEKQTSRESIRKINSISTRFIGVITTLTICISFGLYEAGILIGSDTEISLKDFWLFKFIAWLLSIIKPSEFQNVTEKIERNKSENLFNQPEAGDSSVIAKILEFVFYTVVGIILFVLIVLAVRLIYRKVIEFITGGTYREKEEKESLFNINDVIEDFKDSFKSIKDIFSVQFDFSNRGRIRKIYYKLVTKNIRDKAMLKPSKTPIEIHEIILKDSNKNIEEATDIYEKARYGKDDCSKEDVDRIKYFKA